MRREGRGKEERGKGGKGERGKGCQRLGCEGLSAFPACGHASMGGGWGDAPVLEGLGEACGAHGWAI